MSRTLQRFNGDDAAIKREMFMENVRKLMYSTSGQRQAPFLLFHAAAGDFGPFEAATKSSGGSTLRTACISR